MTPRTKRPGLVSNLTMLRSVVAVLCAGLLAGACASAPIKKKDAIDLAQADKLVAEGCFDCLSDALVIYKNLKDATAAGEEGNFAHLSFKSGQ